MLLLGDDVERARLRSELGTVRAAQWRRLYEQCATYRIQPLPAEHPTASITYMGAAAANLALAYRLTGQTHYLDEAWRWISTCVSYPHWGKAKLPDHDLDAGWLLHGLSLAYSWLGDDLDPDRRAQLAAKLLLQGERLYDYALATEGRWWSSSYWQNHNWICYAGLATVGYALGREDWTQRARANFDLVLTRLPADGSLHEGVVYWRYGTPWLAIYLDLLERTEGTSLWDDCPFLANTMTWRFHQSLPGFEENFNHGDCHDRRSGHSVALYYKLASAYRDGRAQWLASDVAERSFWREAYVSGVKPGVMPEAYYELLWYDPEIEATGLDEEPLSRYFPDLGQVTTRTSWTDPAATALSFKSAPGGGNTAWDMSEQDRIEKGWTTLDAGHHHPDGGAFVLASHGAYLAVDDGYANGKRADHHNLVTVDGHGWLGDDRKHVYDGLPYTSRPLMVDVLADSGFVHATAKTAAMFDPTLAVRQLDRTVVVTPLGRVVIYDRALSDHPHRWSWLLHSDWPSTDADGADAVIRSGPGQLWLTRVAGTSATLRRRVTPVEANPTGSTPSLVIITDLQTTYWETEPVAEATFWTVLEPTGALDPEPARARYVGRGVQIGSELVLLAEDHNQIRHDDVIADARALIRSDQQVAVVQATSVRIGEREWTWESPYTGLLGR